MKELSPVQQPKLTEQELKVLALRAEEKSIAEISEILVIEESTVKFHLTNIYEKLGLRNLNSRSARLLKIQQYYQQLSRLQDTNVLATEPVQQLEPVPKPEKMPEPSPQILILVLEDEVAAIQSAAIPIPPSFRHRSIRTALMLILAAAIIGGFIAGGITALFFLPQIHYQARTILPTIAATMEQPASKSTPAGISVAELNTTTSSLGTNTKLTKQTSLCGETKTIHYPITQKFLRSQGVSAFSVENTAGAVLNNFIRSLTIDQRGVWIGYFTTKENLASGVGLYTKQTWVNCNSTGGITNQNVNNIKIDKMNKIWVATDGAGVSVFDGTQWHTYTTQDGLPSDATFSLTIDDNNMVWTTTQEGIASFDGRVWRVPFSASNNTLFHNSTHAIAFDHAGNIWIGHINDGVSQYDNVSGKWVYHTTKTSKLGGNQIRDIMIRKADANHLESVWFATADGGISKFEGGAWTVYQVKDGLPSNEVHTLAIDKYNRIWAATLEGITYLEGSSWIPYNTLNTLSIAFGPSCQGCPYDDEHIWTGTEKFGLTHSRLPYINNEKAIKVQEVCFESETTRQRVCPSLEETEINHHHIISATYPISLTSGEKLRFEVVVTPRTPYQLREDRGDFLSNTDENNRDRFGAYEHISVKGTIESGQPFLFTDYDSLLVAPQLSDAEHERVFTSTWRVWMHTRYVGPSIHIIFTVHKNSST